MERIPLLAATRGFIDSQREAEAGVPCRFLRARGDRGLLLWSTFVGFALAFLLYLVLPTSTVGWDSDAYLAMARHPFDSGQVMPFPTRILVPLLVWVLPFDPDVGFHITTIGGLTAGAVIVAFIARRIGVHALALAAAPAYVLSFHGIYGTWQWRLIDAVSVPLFGAGLLAAYNHRKVATSVLAGAAAAAKEIGVTLPLAYLAARSGGIVRRRRLFVETALVALLPLTVFIGLRLLVGQSVALAPQHEDWNTEQWDPFRSYTLGITMYREWGYGRPLVQVLVQNHGLLFLLWPLALLFAPGRWRRMHLYALLLLPILAGGPWARSTMYLLPFVLPSGLLLLSRLPLGRASVAVAASIAVAVPLSLRNIAIDELSSNLWLVPGAIVFAVAAAPAVREAAERAVVAVRSRRAPPTPDPARGSTS